MTLKLSSKISDPDAFMKLINRRRVFGGYNVISGTVFIGLWHLAIHFLAFFLFVVAHYIVPTYYCNFPTLTSLPLTPKNSDLIIRPIMNDDINEFTDSDLKSIYNGDGSKLWLYMSTFSFIATSSLIYGAAKKKSLYVLPFFFMQLFDLLFDLAILVMYIASSSSVSEFFNEVYYSPFQQHLHNVGFYQKAILTCIYVLLAFAVKVYMTVVIYLCHRYLTYYTKCRRDGNVITEGMKTEITSNEL